MVIGSLCNPETAALAWLTRGLIDTCQIQIPFLHFPPRNVGRNVENPTQAREKMQTIVGVHGANHAEPRPAHEPSPHLAPSVSSTRPTPDEDDNEVHDEDADAAGDAEELVVEEEAPVERPPTPMPPASAATPTPPPRALPPPGTLVVVQDVVHTTDIPPPSGPGAAPPAPGAGLSSSSIDVLETLLTRVVFLCSPSSLLVPFDDLVAVSFIHCSLPFHLIYFLIQFTNAPLSVAAQATAASLLTSASVPSPATAFPFPSASASGARAPGFPASASTAPPRATPHNERAAMLAEMARAFSLGLGLGAGAGAGGAWRRGLAVAATSTPNSAAATSGSRSAGANALGGAGGGVAGVEGERAAQGEDGEEPAEGSFEPFLRDLQTELRAALAVGVVLPSTDGDAPTLDARESESGEDEGTSSAPSDEELLSTSTSTPASSTLTPSTPTPTRLAPSAAALTSAVNPTAPGALNWWRLYRFPAIVGTVSGAGAGAGAGFASSAPGAVTTSAIGGGAAASESESESAHGGGEGEAPPTPASELAPTPAPSSSTPTPSASAPNAAIPPPQTVVGLQSARLGGGGSARWAWGWAGSRVGFYPPEHGILVTDASGAGAEGFEPLLPLTDSSPAETARRSSAPAHVQGAHGLAVVRPEAAGRITIGSTRCVVPSFLPPPLFSYAGEDAAMWLVGEDALSTRVIATSPSRTRPRTPSACIVAFDACARCCAVAPASPEPRALRARTLPGTLNEIQSHLTLLAKPRRWLRP
ncbi:hypothetical protein DFH09DRAFT_1086243 [Mycena vulgaris]|nr:hypothetical protein DFH09DRAFT_1086243 [Mycena vulgaris]